jgi:hypothetical protein
MSQKTAAALKPCGAQIEPSILLKILLCDISSEAAQLTEFAIRLFRDSRASN